MPKPIDFPRLVSLIEEASEQPLVLVVDDDAELCDSLWDLLRENDFRVCLAHSVNQAVGQLHGQDYRVVLIDLKLPEGDGGDVLRLVRSKVPSARAVLITGFQSEMEELIRQVVADGADAVCYKPFNVSKLLATVQQLAS
jgi:DNA-binding response OmpR family regulator